MIIKTQLSEKEMPTKFYNISADLKEPLPPVLHPGRKDPVDQMIYHRYSLWN